MIKRMKKWNFKQIFCFSFGMIFQFTKNKNLLMVRNKNSMINNWEFIFIIIEKWKKEKRNQSSKNAKAQTKNILIASQKKKTLLPSKRTHAVNEDLKIEFWKPILISFLGERRNSSFLITSTKFSKNDSRDRKKGNAKSLSKKSLFMKK